MRTRKEIQALAFKEYPDAGIALFDDIRWSQRAAFLKAYEMGQAEQKTKAIEPVISQRDAKEWGEFIIRCDREGSPLLLLEDYIDQYCSQ